MFWLQPNLIALVEEIWNFSIRKMFVWYFDLSYSVYIQPLFPSWLTHVKIYWRSYFTCSSNVQKLPKSVESMYKLVICIKVKFTVMAGPKISQRNVVQSVRCVTWFIRPGKLSLRINGSPMFFSGPFDGYWADQDHHSKAAIYFGATQTQLPKSAIISFYCL